MRHARRSLLLALLLAAASASAEDPIETFKRHVWVSPFHEDDVLALRELLGADRLLMGSDFPHAEGLADPSEYVNELKGFREDEIALVMRENALGLSQPRPVSAS